MCGALNSLLFSTPYCAIALRNGIVPPDSDDVGGGTTASFVFEFVSSSLFNCFFDFTPPPTVPGSCAAVFGAVGEEDNPIAGVVSYRLQFGKHCERDLLLVVFFYCERSGEVCAVVQPNLVTHQQSSSESEEDTLERFCCITTQAAECADDVRRVCDSSSHALGPKSSRAKERRFSVPLEQLFADGHRDASIVIDVSRDACGGIVISLFALLNAAASQLQQEHFSESQYQHHIQADEAPANGAPATAAIHHIEQLQSVLLAAASKFEELRSTPPHRSPAPRGVVPVVLANCGEVPLYFGNIASSSLSMLALSNTPFVQWHRTPPPEIPPHSFCVAHMLFFDDGAYFPPLRYETNDGICRFDIVASDDGGGNDKDDSGNEANTTASPTAPAPSAGAEGRELVCSAQSPVGATETSSSVTLVRTVQFHFVFMTVRPMDDAAKDAITAEDDAGKAALRDYGWYVV